MKVTFFFFLFAVTLAFSSEAYACSTTALGAESCNGCRTDKIRRNSNWLKFYKELKGAIPDSAIFSCYRTQACQRELVRTCRKGQASTKTSNHTSNIAMDISVDYSPTAKQLARNILAGHYTVMTNQCNHRGFHMTNGNEKCGKNYTGQGRSSNVVELIQQVVASDDSAQPKDGSYRYNGVPITCRDTKKGGWYQRRNGEWVKMMSECPY